MTEVRYTESHEWARLEEDGTVTCGITKHAAEELNELTFVDFQVGGGDTVAKGGTIAEIETVKATAELDMIKWLEVKNWWSMLATTQFQVRFIVLTDWGFRVRQIRNHALNLRELCQ